jgi:transcriptional regulator with XRE-family HTH domain
MTKIRDKALLLAFGQRIRKLRLERGLSQSELDALSNVDRVQIERIENGKVNTSLSTIKLLAMAFEMTMSQLMDIKEIDENSEES